MQKGTEDPSLALKYFLRRLLKFYSCIKKLWPQNDGGDNVTETQFY